VAEPAQADPQDDFPPLPAPAAPDAAAARDRAARRVGVGQLVCWQIAAALIVAVAIRPVPVWPLATACGAAGTLVLVTAVRWRGIWWYQWAGVWIRYRVRTRTSPLGGSPPGTAIVAAVAAGSAETELTDGDRPLGVLTHRGGLAVLIEVTANEPGLVSEHAVRLPSPESLLARAGAGEAALTAQLVIQCVPAGPADASGPAASYRQLTGGRVPALRRAWIVVQAQRTVDGHPDADLRRVLSGAACRLLRRLDRDGLGVRPLDRSEALAAVAAIAAVDPLAAPSQPLTEAWRWCLLPGSAQATFRVRRWPDAGQPRGAQLADRLVTASVGIVTLAIAARRQDGALEVEAAIRLCCSSPAALADAGHALVREAAECGADLARLDGEQLHGLAATLPFGGFLP
jgi:type VII secretion protein EccE